MTCRMLVAIGQLTMASLLDSFKLVALSRNANEKHELNRDNCNFVHPDGWGIVIGRSGKLEEYYKKDIACWNDRRFLEYYQMDANFVILHARRASAGNPTNLSFTQPYERDGWYFCHNGTVNDYCSGKISDSEVFFSHLLDGITKTDEVTEGIKNTVDQIKDYTALNFILATNDKVYVFVKHTQKPDYYTMKYLQTEGHSIISSEKLPTFEGEWTEVSSGTLLSLDVVTRRIESFEI